MFKTLKTASIALATTVALTGVAQAQVALNGLSAIAEGHGASTHIGVALNAPSNTLRTKIDLHGNTQGGIAGATGNINSNYDPILNTGDFTNGITLTGAGGGTATMTGRQFNPVTGVNNIDRTAGIPLNSPTVTGNSRSVISGLDISTLGSVNSLDLRATSAGTAVSHSAVRNVNINAGSILNGGSIKSVTTGVGGGTDPVSSRISNINIHADGSIRDMAISSRAVGNYHSSTGTESVIHNSINSRNVSSTVRGVNVRSTGGSISGVTIGATAIGNHSVNRVTRSGM